MNHSGTFPSGWPIPDLPCGHPNTPENLQPRKVKRKDGYKTTMICRMCRKIQNHKHYMNKKKRLAKENKT